MPLTKNEHIVEEINGERCSIVEKNATAERSAFIKRILEHNGYTVRTAPSPPPRAVPAAEGEKADSPAAPETFTVGVTDRTFNIMVAIYMRALHTPEGRLVTPALWNGEEGAEGRWYWK